MRSEEGGKGVGEEGLRVGSRAEEAIGESIVAVLEVEEASVAGL